jgi:hypothetical protein
MMVLATYHFELSVGRVPEVKRREYRDQDSGNTDVRRAKLDFDTFSHAVRKYLPMACFANRRFAAFSESDKRLNSGFLFPISLRAR